MTTLIPPPYTSLDQLTAELRTQGYAVLKPADVLAFAQCQLAGHYRRRRHSCFVAHDAELEQVPHRAHYQPLQYNALHGGMHRMFEPIKAEMLQSPLWPRLLLAIGNVCSQVKQVQPWYVEAHQFRIDTTGGIGRPTPEGAHRDGVDFVAILLVDRVNVTGGESRIFDADGPHGQRFTLREPWTLLILDDQRVIHETTPIQPTAAGGHRDTLVLTFRAGGFLEEAR